MNLKEVALRHDETVDQFREPESVGEVTVRISSERVAMDYFFAYRVAEAAFALFDALAGQEANPAAVNR